MKNKGSIHIHYKEWILIGICIASIIMGIIFYPLMPERMVSHWGANGEPNGYMSNFWGSFLLPLITLAMFVLLFFIPRMDPLRENIEKFKEYFLNFLIILLLFMLALQAFMISWNIGYRIDIIFIIIPLFSILFFYMGVMLSKTKQNMSIGIRTPWTLKSAKVWDLTHKRTAPLMKAAAIIFLLGLLMKKQAFIIIFIAIIAVFLYSFIYSYIMYEKEQQNKRGKKE